MVFLLNELTWSFTANGTVPFTPLTEADLGRRTGGSSVELDLFDGR